MSNHTQSFSEQPLFQRRMRGNWDCQYRIPNLLVSKKGTVFAFPEERVDSVADEAKHHLVMRRSFDHGKTWNELEPLRETSNPRVSYSFGGGVADQETGRVIVMFGVNVVIGPDDIGGAWPEQWRSEHPEGVKELQSKLAPDVDTGRFVIWTDDDGDTWSEPTALGDQLSITNPVTGEQRRFGAQFTGIQLQYGPHRGRLLIPGRGFTKGSPFDLFAYSHNYVVYSDDHGVTWQAGGLTQNGTGEACLVELTDGTVYVNSRNESLRCRGYRGWDRSYDGGKTFVESGYDLALPEPHCAASMVRYSGPPTGPNQILFCNPAVHSDTASHYDHDARTNLTVRLSEDDCRTWPVGRTICEGQAGYSALAAAADGTILCAYETLTERSYSGDIMVARFSLDWLLEG